MEGRGRRSQRPVLRIPPQRGDLVTLCLDLQAPARLLQVGRDGRNRVTPHPARPLPAPAGRRSHWLRRHPAQPASSETAADGGCEHDPGDDNAIFNDLLGSLRVRRCRNGIGRLRALLQAESHYAPVLAGFEAIDQGRRVLEDAMASAEARQRADDLIWQGSVELLEHEQRALVQPNFDRLSCSSAWVVAIGSATSFEVRGVRQEIADFTSFYLYSLTRGIPMLCAHGRGLPHLPAPTIIRWWWKRARTAYSGDDGKAAGGQHGSCPEDPARGGPRRHSRCHQL